MRISATKVCQLVRGDPPALVLKDDTTDHEMILSPRETYYLFRAIGYFSTDLGLFDEEFDVPEKFDTPAGLVAPAPAPTPPL